MRSLSSYIYDNVKPFTAGGTTSNKLLIFDVDDTLIHTTANIWIMKNGRHINTISNAEFNHYNLKPGEVFDFREFDDPKILSRESFTKYWDTLKREYKKGTHICILTARCDTEMIRKFFLRNGIDIKPDLIFATGDPLLGVRGTVQEKKAAVIGHLTRLGYSNIIFFDDDEGNLQAAKNICNKLNVKIHTVKA